MATWARQALDEAATNRIGNHCKNDRDGARLLQQCSRGGGAVRKNEIGLQRDQLLREPLHHLRVGPGPAGVDPYVAAFRPPELLERFPKCCDPGLCFRVDLGIAHQHADSPHSVGLLRARRKRPGHRAPDERDELAAAHSITSSARASSDGGNSRSSAFAVLRLSIRSNFVGCWTGKSPGLAPLKILSMNKPCRRNTS